jgi:hypothetical protein
LDAFHKELAAVTAAMSAITGDIKQMVQRQSSLEQSIAIISAVLDAPAAAFSLVPVTIPAQAPDWRTSTASHLQRAQALSAQTRANLDRARLHFGN